MKAKMILVVALLAVLTGCCGGNNQTSEPTTITYEG